jgi:hypothetical protein
MILIFVAGFAVEVPSAPEGFASLSAFISWNGRLLLLQRLDFLSASD